MNPRFIGIVNCIELGWVGRRLSSTRLFLCILLCSSHYAFGGLDEIRSNWDDDPHRLWNQALRLANSQRYREAWGHLETVIRLNPPDVHEAWRDLGLVQERLNQFESAIKSYDEALAIKHDYTEAILARGRSLSALGRHLESLASIDQAIESQPENTKLWNARARPLIKLKRLTDASNSLLRAIELDSVYFDAHMNLGNVLDKLGRLEASLASYRTGLNINPESHQAWHSHGVALSKLERYVDAITSYDTALGLNTKDPTVYYSKGDALLELGRYKEAIRNFDIALEIDPNDCDAWNNRGFAMARLKKYAEAIVNFRTAIEVCPRFALIHYNIAGVYSMQGELSQAYAALEKSADLSHDVLNGIELDFHLKPLLNDVVFGPIVKQLISRKAK